MKLLDFWSDKGEYTDRGIIWYKCREYPFTTIIKPDRIYYSYILFELRLHNKRYYLQIRLRKQAYRNKEEYKIERRKNGNF